MQKKSNLKIFYALSIALQLGFFIAVPIVGFLFLGLLGDKYLKTHPLFLVLGLLIGIILSVYEVHHLLIPLMKKGKNA